MILAKEIDGELWVKASDHHRLIKDAQRTWVGLTKTTVGNHLRRHALGEQPTFQKGFKEGVVFAELKLKEKNT